MAYDSIVIGGGVMGSAIALRLAQAGQKVLVLERAVPGAEASSAAGGILGPQIEGNEGGPLFELCLASREEYPSFAEELLELSGVDIGFRRCGLLQVAIGEEDPGLSTRYQWQKEAGLEVERLSGAEARELEPGLNEATAAALLFPMEGQVDPRALAKALPIAAARAGAVFRRERVQKILVDSSAVEGVEVDGGRLFAPSVIVCAGAWTSLVEGIPLAKDTIQPLRGQMVELRHPEAILRRIVFTSKGYLVPQGEGAFIAGSTMERVGFEKKVTAEGIAKILDQAKWTAPPLAGAEVSRLWSGLRPAPKDGRPLIGCTTKEGLYVASGHHRNGILLTPITATLLARAVLEGKESGELEFFSPRRFAT